MKIADRSAQVWSLLAFAATNRQSLTYEMVSKLTGMHAAGLGPILEPIQSYCVIHELPSLTALVVSKATGLPSPGFVAATDVPRELIRVFEHDWLGTRCPSPEELTDAARVRPSNGVLPAGPAAAT
jgi:hypothetical protein